MLAASPDKVWADLEKEGAVVITEDGAPRSIMIPTSGETLLDDVRENRVRPRKQGDSGDPQACCGDRYGSPDARGHRSRNRGVETGAPAA